MVFVDTTVWIDFFTARSVGHVQALERLIEQGEDICICGVVLAEVLQDILEDAEFRKTRDLFMSLIFLPIEYKTFLQSAELYRVLRKKGVTIRKPLDCMIAAIAIKNKVPLLHNDKDFHPIEKYCGLTRYSATKNR